MEPGGEHALNEVAVDAEKPRKIWKNRSTPFHLIAYSFYTTSLSVYLPSALHVVSRETMATWNRRRSLHLEIFPSCNRRVGLCRRK